jgi:MFS family permease
MTMAVYMLIPLLPVWMGLSVKDTALVMGSYGVGLFLLGGFCNFLVQHYRRNMVCVWALVAMIAVMGGFYLMATNPELKNVETLTALRVACGAAFGLAQMVLMSTLVIDTSESFRRTEANHSAAWFERVALALGPLTGWAVNYLFGAQYVFVAAAACCFAAVVLILLVDACNHNANAFDFAILHNLHLPSFKNVYLFY